MTAADDTSKNSAWLDRAARTALALVALVGAAALAGWLFDFLIIASLRRSFIPMAPFTALFFLILCAGALFQLQRPQSRAARSLVPAAALLVTLLSLTIALDYFNEATALDLERLLPFASGRFDAVPTGRMSPISALCFALAGSALFLLSDRFRSSSRWRQVSALLSATVTLAGLVLLLGYLHGAPLLYGQAVIPVALPSAIAFVALGTGLCAMTGADMFPQRLFLGDSLRSRLMRAFLPVTVATVFFQGLLDARFYKKVSNLSLIASLMTLVSVTVVGFLITAIARFIGNKMDAAEGERLLAEQELSASEERFRAFFGNSIDAMFFSSPEGRIFSANPEACRIFQMSEEEICARGWDGLLESDPPRLKAQAERVASGKFRGELTGKRSDGTRFPIEISTWVFRDREGRERMGSTARDITEQKRVEEELRESNRRLNELSNVDPLTQLYNRRFLMESFDKELKRQQRNKGQLTLVMFDVDHFKLVNDVFGHQRGDDVLTAIAQAARELLRGNDIAARYGGEEFVLLLPDTTLAGGVVVAERLREAVQRISFAAPMEHLSVTVSVGVATYPASALDGVDQLLGRADEALYRAKRAGRNRVEIKTASTPS